eukprot:COSAG06_NODE_51141_length_314_cov_0.711628_1_plen_92_part_10
MWRDDDQCPAFTSSALAPDRAPCVAKSKRFSGSGAPLATSPQNRMHGLTPDQRFEFDVRGFVVIDDAVDSETLAELQRRLDVFEQLGQRYRR